MDLSSWMYEDHSYSLRSCCCYNLFISMVTDAGGETDGEEEENCSGVV